MYNSSLFKFLKIFSFIFFITCFFSCKKEVTLNFTETQIIDEGEITIEINIPKAEGKSKVAGQINTTLTHFVNNALNIDGIKPTRTNTKESIAEFKKTYIDFKTQIGKSLYTDLPSWEVLIDGEVLYKSEALICIAMNSSINTGGAHSNLVFQFFNFDIKTGKQLTTKNLVNDIQAFTTLAKKYYDKELLSAEDNRIAAFETEAFEIPENLGFSDDGVIVFYDTFNSANNNVIEFTIPFIAADPYLNF